MEKKFWPTPHINACPSDFADTVIMPGDPLRSRLIASDFLENARLVNDVRGVQGYTGTYRGKSISVMASGMGMPSMGIYSYELFNFFGVQNIIRTGSAGALQDSVKLRDMVFGKEACTDSNYAGQLGITGDFAAFCDSRILRIAEEEAKKAGVRYHVGSILTTDVFYRDKSYNEKWRDMGVLAVEMETAALYINAARANKNALAVYTVSDCVFTGEQTSSEERQNSFLQMIETALNTAARL